MSHHTVAALPKTSARRVPAPHRQTGLTLIELMVALVLGLMIAAAAVAALIVARQGFNSVDGGTQLRENIRFASNLMQRIGVQAGFHNISYGSFPDPNAPPGVRGYDNAGVTIVEGATNEPTFPVGGVNNSDVVAIRFWGASLTQLTPGVAQPADGSMINCAGIAEPEGAAADPASSIFHIAISGSGEPTLVCTYRDPAPALTWHSVALVQGVESLQVLYGVDGVTPNAVPPPPATAATTPGVNDDAVAERYLRASQLEVPGNAAATLDNWRRVRSLRIGMVVRGPANGTVDRAATKTSYAVLGTGFTSATDTGSTLVIGTPDGRLRQQLVFNVHLRNPQDQRPTP